MCRLFYVQELLYPSACSCLITHYSHLISIAHCLLVALIKFEPCQNSAITLYDHSRWQVGIYHMAFSFSIITSGLCVQVEQEAAQCCENPHMLISTLKALFHQQSQKLQKSLSVFALPPQLEDCEAQLKQDSFVVENCVSVSQVAPGAVSSTKYVSR